MGRRIAPISPDLMVRMKRYDWPGNVRELQNVVERGVITARHGRLDLDHALPRPAQPDQKAVSETPLEAPGRILTEAQIRRFERDNLQRALETSRWRVAGKKGASKLLGIPPSTLQSRMKTLGIKRPD